MRPPTLPTEVAATKSVDGQLGERALLLQVAQGLDEGHEARR